MKKLEGNWYNELGSVMNLKISGNKVTGTYQTKVGDETEIYDLIGRIDTENKENAAIGWVVVWTNKYSDSDSVTCWSGQYVSDGKGNSMIAATWLLTMAKNQDNWKSTLIGKDVFRQTKPTEQDLKNIKSTGIDVPFPVMARLYLQ